MAKNLFSRRFFEVIGQILTTPVDPFVDHAMRKANEFPDIGQRSLITRIGKGAHKPEKPGLSPRHLEQRTKLR